MQRARGLRSRARDDVVVVGIALASLATVLLADLSGMSKAEVERIWLPFVPWLLVGTALLPRPVASLGAGRAARLRRPVQHLLATGW